MSLATSTGARRRGAWVRSRPRAGSRPVLWDLPLLLTVGLIMLVGWIMVFSASVALADRLAGASNFFMLRHGLYLLLTLGLMALLVRVPIDLWRETADIWIGISLLTLVAVLLPGIGHTVNGSTRWLNLGIVTLQPSEFARVALLLWVAATLATRKATTALTLPELARPLLLLALMAILLLQQPDFGATAVLAATLFVVLFLAGLAWWQVAALGLGGGALLGLFAVAAPYRLARLTSFLDPWADPYNSGFQLTQALIAIGRGGLDGVGLGSSIQKLSYLPEAHTDFLFAIFAEEAGLIGVTLLLGLYLFLVLRGYRVARLAWAAGDRFGALLVYGLITQIGLQALINIGVNMGLLPTKGLTLPLMSFGGSSLLASGAVIALVLRVDHERQTGARSRR
ncbi:MAG: putative lipid II flippase FtsW [Gammaproteobacteria bacterium]|nr:putative lipid II flippase FtsW [Gammaproteobacteria bacterium]